jgi:hypothetical protein
MKRDGFESKYEEQKIPEWYDSYFDYRHIKALIAATKLSIKCKAYHVKS